MKSLLAKLVLFFQNTNRSALWMMALIAGGTWMFIELADEVIEGETTTVDEKILLSLRNPDDKTDPIGSAFVEDIGRDLTALGGGAILFLLVFGAAGFLCLIHKQRTAIFMLIAIGSGTLVSQLLKLFFDRPRPDLVPHGSYVYTSSFPSGHSMISAVTYLTLAILLARVTQERRAKIFIIAVAVFTTILVGVSRVYLGVHWPTDVAAGWTAGAVWALLCDQVADWLQKKRQIETEVVAE